MAATKDLIGPALDWAVAKCEGWEYDDPETPSRDDRNYKPSINWSQGGPIIEREVIVLTHPKWDCWTASKQGTKAFDLPLYSEDGPTPLVAAMRCFVASRLGDTVEVPEELQ